jgi:hypothetical protein
MLTLLSLKVGDVYISSSAVIISIIPWVLFFSNRKTHHFPFLFLLISGILIGLSESIRSGSGIPVAVFILVMILLSKKGAQLISVGLLLVGMLSVNFFFSYLNHRTTEYLIENNPDQGLVTLVFCSRNAS